MVHPKYSPEEALQRVKLMMGYDTKKTLTENVKSTSTNLSEQTNIFKDIAAGATVGAGGGFVFGGGPIGLIPGAVIGGIYALIVGMTSSSIREDNFKQLVKACSTNKSELGKKTLDDATFDKLSDTIYTAIDGLGTNEDAIKSVFLQIPTVPDLCGLVDNYQESYGDLVSDLDGDLDGDTEWRDYVFLPLRPAIRASKNASEKKDNDNQKTGGGGGGGTSYKPCTGTYQIGCKSDVIAKVQGCLKISADGKFGPKTKAALSGKGFTTFTDADVAKICSTEPEEKLGSDVESQTLGQDQNVSNTNTNVDSNSNQPDSTTKSGIS
jgi:hypothetical protein